MQEFQKIVTTKKKVRHVFDKKMPLRTIAQKFTILGLTSVKKSKTLSQTLTLIYWTFFPCDLTGGG